MASSKKSDAVASKTSKSQQRPFLIRVSHKLEDLVDDINWIHIGFKTCAYTYIALMLWITWQVLPLPGHWTISQQSDNIPIKNHDFTSYFNSFVGASECGIRATDLYHFRPVREDVTTMAGLFCPNRKTLLEAMSNGGRIGFDAPYESRNCHYRWYEVEEICMILERFSRIIFVGDDSLQTVYNGFNILLRQDLALGALSASDSDPKMLQDCRCDNQFIKASCNSFFIKSRDDIVHNPTLHGNPYLCPQTPHTMLPITKSPTSEEVKAQFESLLSIDSHSKYKPIPIIHSLSPNSASQIEASNSLLEFHKLAGKAYRKTPILWIGPTATGHVEIKNRKGNQEIWNFDRDVANVARENGIEILKMWNMTVQANSWDGAHFGERVAITQAMMVINWLSRLASS